jgi:hypothetical protein
MLHENAAKREINSAGKTSFYSFMTKLKMGWVKVKKPGWIEG